LAAPFFRIWKACSVSDERLPLLGADAPGPAQVGAGTPDSANL